MEQNGSLKTIGLGHEQGCDYDSWRMATDIGKN